MVFKIEDVKQRHIVSNGIQLKIAEQGTGPLVLLLHGFPESWYSWRHQFAPIANAGFKCVAPDMRGYGESDKPSDINAYNQHEIMADIIGLIPALGYETAIVIGHDWGAPTAWGCALHHPEYVSAVGGLSVPFAPRSEYPPLDILNAIFKDQFFYQLYFQTPGIAEAEFEADIEVSLRKFLHLASAQAFTPNALPKSKDADMLSDYKDPGELADWCSREDLAYYIGQFERSSFAGPLNYYRNLNLNWSLTKHSPRKIHQPAMYAAGDRDGVVTMLTDVIKDMPNHVTDLRINAMIPGAGHWTQQEAPEAVNELILAFLHEVSS